MPRDGRRCAPRAARSTDVRPRRASAASASALAREIEERTGYETRVTMLGHVQRGGSPTAFDRVLATRYGVLAADLVHEGNFGQMAALRGVEIVRRPLLEAAVAQLKTVPQELFDLAATFFA